MQTILLLVVTFAGYLIAYHTYGRFLARRIFRLDDGRATPAVSHNDGHDYVPTRRGVIFGHHFTSIAGTGPIVGPAIGIIWGWVPALLWVFFGSIVMGAVHDLGTLVMSLRNQGRSIADITARYINPRVRYIFFLVIFLELLIVVAIFGMVIAVIFARFPQAVFPVWLEVPIAITLGWLIYQRGAGTTLSTVIAVLIMYVTVILGHYIPLTMPVVAGIPATGVWTIILLSYAFIASTLPVTTLLQPRDYINAWQLIVAMLLLVGGVLATGFSGDLRMVAPAFNLHPTGAPALWPMLFITIACGAISGFHALVSSGTSSKQVARERDALFVGYGSMLMEAVLATLVLIAVGAGIGLAYQAGDGTVLTGLSAWQEHYSSWTASQGLSSKIEAVVIGSANLIAALGVPRELGIVLMGVFIASFAGTTLDSATRIQRYVVTELFTDLRVKPLTNRFTATAFAVLTAALLAFTTGADGKGALTLWPLFGSINQLLAALALVLLTIYLRRHHRWGWLIAGLPALFMVTVTFWSVLLNQLNFFRSEAWLLLLINTIVLLLSCWIVLEGGVALFCSRKQRPAPHL